MRNTHLLQDGGDQIDHFNELRKDDRLLHTAFVPFDIRQQLKYLANLR